MEMSFLLNLVHSHRCVCTCVFFIKGVRVAHPHHWRRAAGHGDRTVLWCVGTDQRPGCHPVLLSAEHLLQEGNSLSRFPRHASHHPCVQKCLTIGHAQSAHFHKGSGEVLKCWAHLTSQGFYKKCIPALCVKTIFLLINTHIMKCNWAEPVGFFFLLHAFCSHTDFNSHL